MNNLFKEKEELQNFSMLETEGLVDDGGFPWRKIAIVVSNVVLGLLADSESEK